ncbi:protein Abitram isoform X2 [Diabrotica virgifera virgifera]|uniref:Protein Abitram n=1 Tax=Diabrotica virgifera virgifera TaxID=50390 RepID=A0A6P7F629_DIAVI|nr:protein Abitram isoform X2 [Diabrotica virgifera virgifera]
MMRSKLKFILLILVTFKGGLSSGLRCYVCSDGGDMPCINFDSEKEKFVQQCSASQKGCHLKVEGDKKIRSCFEKKIDDCKVANEVEYCFCSTDLCNSAKAGKRKFGAKQVKPNSTICQVKLEEENFTRNIRAGITGYIVEINESVKEDPDLLVRDPKGKGFVAILKLKGQHGQLDEILNNMPLLTEEEYEKTLRDRNETNNAAID